LVAVREFVFLRHAVAVRVGDAMNDDIPWTAYKVCEGVELLSKHKDDPALDAEFEVLCRAMNRLQFVLSVVQLRLPVREAAE
jgi:hypothetical protein